jgi:hypothetical protein
VEEQKSYYAIIPANVRYDTDLPPNAKLLYGEITALCNEKGYCWASNKYFADLYGTSTRSIQNWMGALTEKGYIRSKVKYKKGSKIVESRFISIVIPHEKNFTTPRKNFHGGDEKNFTTPHEENFVENNTVSFNTTKNKKKERKNGYDAILSTVDDDGLRELYLEYIKMRKLIKSPMTDRALTMLIKKVNDLEPCDVSRQKRLLETAIMNNWKSVYPLRDEPNKAKSFDADDFFNAAMSRGVGNISSRAELERSAAERMAEEKPKTNDPDLQKRAEELRNKLKGERK